MAQLELNVGEAARRRDEGMQSAVDHAESAWDGWKKLALAAFKEHAQSHDTFTTEDVRADHLSVPPPPEPRAWGAIATEAKKLGYVAHAGFVQAQSVKVHRMWVRVWRSRLRP